jgi:peptidoglycan-associated lipoprotein
MGSRRLCIALIAAAALGGCAHAKTNANDTSADNQAPPGQAPAKVAELKTATEHSTQGLSEADLSAHKDLEVALEALRMASVFFGLDDDRITPEGQQRLGDVGLILSKHSNFRIRVEGNCDERGTSQYNIVLGQKRADAARAYLLRMGAAPDQVATVSYGKERPRVEGHDEKAWQQNRRDDVVVVGGP